jgi:peptidoglycan/LPS O-acetylase OafA/YrhL
VTRRRAGAHDPAPHAAQRPAPAARKVGWDLLRCVCVLMVVLYHSTYIGPTVYRQFWPRELVFGHQIGASLLLAISAYFIPATLSRVTGSTASWWRHKLARLLPPFVVATCAAWFSLRFLAPPGMFHPNLDTLWTNLAMLWNWDGVRTWDYVDGSYWTIPLQLMAFTVAALLRRTPLGHGRGLRLLMWAAVAIPLAQWDLREHAGGLYLSIVDGFGLYRWHLFVAGLAVWMLATGRLGRRHGAALLTACVVAHAIQIGEPVAGGGFTTDWWSVVGVGAGVVAMTVAAVGPDHAARLPQPVIRAVRWLAGISYGVFLAHQTQGYVVMLWLQDAFGAGPGPQTVAMLAVGLILGWAITRWVERPAHRLVTTVDGAGPAAADTSGVLPGTKPAALTSSSERIHRWHITPGAQSST